MSHKMSVKKIRGMVNSAAKDACKSLGIGQAKKTPKPTKERVVDRHWQAARSVMDKAEVAVHEAKNARTFRAALKKMAEAQKHLTAAYAAIARADKG